MTRPVEEVYSRPSCIRSVGLKDVGIALGSCAPVEIHNLHCNANGFYKNMDE